MLYTAETRDIVGGKITNVCFERTLRILKAKGRNSVIKVEFKVLKDVKKIEIT